MFGGFQGVSGCAAEGQGGEEEGEDTQGEEFGVDEIFMGFFEGLGAVGVEGEDEGEAEDEEVIEIGRRW